MMRCDRVKAACRLPVLLLPLAWSTLGGTAYAQVTPAGGAPTGTAPTGTAPTGTAATGTTNDATPGLVPGVGEIRLDGIIREVSAALGSLILEVSSFTLTTGKTSPLSAPKPRTVLVSDQTSVHRQGATRRLALTDLKPGVTVMVVGADVGSGKDFPAREIAITDKTTPFTTDNTGTGTGNGQGSGGGASGFGGSGDDLIAAKMEFAQQIATLRAEMMREIQKMKPPGGATPAGVTPGGATPATPANTITRKEMNDLIAALRREFADEIGRLRIDVNQLKAANAAPPNPGAVEPEPPAEPPPVEAPAEEVPAEEVPAEEAPQADDDAPPA